MKASNQNDLFPVSPEVIDHLANLLPRILRKGLAEATGQEPICDIFEYSRQLTEMMHHFGFLPKSEQKDYSMNDDKKAAIAAVELVAEKSIKFKQITDELNAAIQEFGSRIGPLLAPISLETLLADVKEFHNAADVPVLTTPTLPSLETWTRREKVMLSELKELEDEWNDTSSGNISLARVLHEGLDVIYVVLGTFLELGLSEAAIEGWTELHASVMGKADPQTGKFVKNAYGKILKPEGFVPVDFEKIVEKHIQQKV